MTHGPSWDPAPLLPNIVVGPHCIMSLWELRRASHRASWPVGRASDDASTRLAPRSRWSCICTSCATAVRSRPSLQSVLTAGGAPWGGGPGAHGQPGGVGRAVSRCFLPPVLVGTMLCMVWWFRSLGRAASRYLLLLVSSGPCHVTKCASGSTLGGASVRMCALPRANPRHARLWGHVWLRMAGCLLGRIECPAGRQQGHSATAPRD